MTLRRNNKIGEFDRMVVDDGSRFMLHIESSELSMNGVRIYLETAPSACKIFLIFFFFGKKISTNFESSVTYTTVNDNLFFCYLILRTFA